jgi:cellobiose phosphorylase
MRFGYFDDAHREYVIERPDTPLPWFNYIGSEEYFGIISNTAGGYSFYRDARLRRLTRYRYNNAPMDVGGRYIYLRDHNTGEFWSPSWQPVKKSLNDYQCRQGMGYTTIQAQQNGIKSTSCYFVPLGQNLEIWKLTLTNQRPTAAVVDVFASIEFCLWDALDDSTNYQRNFSVGEVEIVDNVIYHKTEYRERRNHYAYFTCSQPWAGYDTQREEFLGPYRGWDNPQAVQNGRCNNSLAVGWAPVGVQQLLVNLEPGEEKTLIFLLGYQENDPADKFDPKNSNIINKKGALKVIREYLNVERVDAAFNELRKYWDKLLGSMQVQTPDIHTNRMVNIWNAYQCMVTFNMSRSASGFETGVGRGMGFRDSTQDILGFVQMVPERARERLLDVAATQLPSGGAYHQYQPLTKRGNDGVGGNFNDDPLWLIIATAAYLRETGDWSVLDVKVPYDNDESQAMPLMEHLERSLRYTTDRLGPHGLPLIGRADWNDCLNLNCFSSEPGQSFQTTTNKDGKVAESVMIAGLFIQSCNEMANIAAHLGRVEDQENYIQSGVEMEKVILDAGWDGKWFRRAYNDFGKPIGSNECEEGKIFIEPQGMCIMGGVGIEDGKARQALDSVHEWLATPHGMVLNQPAFTHYYLEMGEISTYPPGYKENASIFCHTNPWIMVSEARLGNGNRAFDYYHRINPSFREEISDIHRCEPYVYCQMIAGKDAPYHGEAKNSWLTGTAAWNYVAITQWILGIRPTYDGLMIRPCLPDEWRGFSAIRFHRNCRYDIDIKRVGSGTEVKLTVDGKQVQGNVIPLPDKNVKEVKVVAEIG